MAEGFHDFAAAEVLTAANTDDYLMRQTVMRFASAAARDTALSGVVVEGMAVYLKDNNRLMVYSGSAWTGIRTGVFSAIGSAVTTSGVAISTTTTLAVADQGCAGTLMLWAHLRVDKTVTTDVFKVSIKESPSTELAYSETIIPGNVDWAHIQTPQAMTAGAGVTMIVTLVRTAGSGTASTYTNGAINRLDAIFIPTQ